MTFAQGPTDDRRQRDGVERLAPEGSHVSICGKDVAVSLCHEVQEYMPRSVENLQSLSSDFIERMAEGAISFSPQVLRQALQDVFSASLVLDRVTASQEALYEIYAAIETSASLALPEFSRGGKPVDELAIGYLLAALVVDSMDPQEGEGRRARDAFKGHVISHVKGQAFEGAVPDGFEEMVRGKLLDCALSNRALAPSISRLLGDWEMLAISGPEATLNLTDEYFSFGGGAALFADHRLMEEALEEEGRALVPKAVEILSSKGNRYNWEDSLSAMEDKIRGHRRVQIALTFNEQRIDSYSFSQYVQALVTSLSDQGFSRFVFEEGRLVPSSMIRSLQVNGDERGLQTIANLAADYLNLPLNAGISTLRSYLGINEMSLDKHAASWVTFVEQLRERVRERQVTVLTIEQDEERKSTEGGVARFEGSLLSKVEGAPFIKISVLRPSPDTVAFNRIMHQAVFDAGRRDGFGELMSAGVDQLHIHEVYKLTEISSVLRPEADSEHYRLVSCADIDLWVFVAVDGDAPEGIEEIVDIDADMPVPALR